MDWSPQVTVDTAAGTVDRRPADPYNTLTARHSGKCADVTSQSQSTAPRSSSTPATAASTSSAGSRTRAAATSSSSPGTAASASTWPTLHRRRRHGHPVDLRHRHATSSGSSRTPAAATSGSSPGTAASASTCRTRPPPTAPAHPVELRQRHQPAVQARRLITRAALTFDPRPRPDFSGRGRGTDAGSFRKRSTAIDSASTAMEGGRRRWDGGRRRIVFTPSRPQDRRQELPGPRQQFPPDHRLAADLAPSSGAGTSTWWAAGLMTVRG